MGEFEFIENIRRAFEGVGGRGESSGGPEQTRPWGSEESGYLGIGDDCAVLPLPGGQEAFVVTTDMLVEGVHFLRRTGSERGAGGRGKLADTSSPDRPSGGELSEARELGAKSLAVNLSDVAAMGARPVASFLSLALPPEYRDDNGRSELTGRPESDQPSRSAQDGDGENVHGSWASEFMEGYREMSERYGVRLAGGDTTASLGGVVINVTAIGRAPLERLKYRSEARVGDIVVVGGPLGESAAGLADILAGRHDSTLAHIHRNPVPQVAEGEWLGGRAEVHSMIDLSDGLASDLVHILRASGAYGERKEETPATEAAEAGSGSTLTQGRQTCHERAVGAEIDLDAIPIAPLTAVGIPVSDAVEFAVTGGEDYKLLFTVAPESFARLAEDYLARFGSPLYHVGRIIAGAPEIVWLENGEPVTKNWRGFVHF